MATERADARLTAVEAADAAVFVDTNTTDLTTILGEFTNYVKGPVSAVDDRIATFNTITGKLIQDGGQTIAQIEASPANVTAAGALMDSEVDADIKTLVLPASTTISTFGASLIDDVAASNARTTLGVDQAGTDNSTDVTLAGTGTYLSLAGQAITVDPITESDISDLGSYITPSSTDTLTNKTFDANGTGNSLSNVDVADLSNGTDGELITWDAAGAPTTVPVGTSTHVLTSNGVGAAPTFQAAAGGAPEGTAVLSTGETVGKVLQADGDNSCSWVTVSGTGDALVANPLSQFASTTSAQFAGVISDKTGSGLVVLANTPTLIAPILGTITSGDGSALTGTAASLTAGNVTTNANLTGGVTSVGNAATVVTNANLTGHITSTGNAAVLGSFTVAQLNTALSDAVVPTTVKLFSFPFDNGASPLDAGAGLPIMLKGTHTLTDLQWTSKTGDTGSIVVELKEASVTGGAQGIFSVLDTLTQLAGDDTIVESGLSITVTDGKVYHANVLTNAGSITGGVLVGYGTLN